MQKRFFTTALALTVLSAVPAVATPVAPQKPLDARALSAIKVQFGRIIDLANKHDLKALHGIFWQSPSALLVAKSAIPSEGNCGFSRL